MRNDLYRASGVNIDAGNEAVDRIKPHARRTLRPEVLAGIGGFGGGFLFSKDRYREPVLLSGTDGVGTKLKIAFAMSRHDTIGVDAVAMCVNDILAMGAEPLFFLDYFATGKLDPAIVESVVKGVADGCVQAGAALIGGETAEMPGMYADGEYDLAGFAVGVVERDGLIDGSRVEEGDFLIGLGSTGLHSNGYSLARKLLADAQVDLKTAAPGEAPEALHEGDAATLGDLLLAPTRIYVRAVRALLDRVDVRAMAHITGGGLLENVPRALPDTLGCVIDPDRWPEPTICRYLRELAPIDDHTLYRTWNMGIGFVLAVPPEEVSIAIEVLQEQGERAYPIGRVTSGAKGVEWARGGMDA